MAAEICKGIAAIGGDFNNGTIVGVFKIVGMPECQCSGGSGPKVNFLGHEHIVFNLGFIGTEPGVAAGMDVGRRGDCPGSRPLRSPCPFGASAFHIIVKRSGRYRFSCGSKSKCTAYRFISGAVFGTNPVVICRLRS